MLTELEPDFRERAAGEKIPQQFPGIGFFSFIEPVDVDIFPLHLAEEDILPLGELADTVEQGQAHFLKGA